MLDGLAKDIHRNVVNSKHADGPHDKFIATFRKFSDAARSGSKWHMLPPEIQDGIGMLLRGLTGIMEGDAFHEPHYVDMATRIHVMLDFVEKRNDA